MTSATTISRSGQLRRATEITAVVAIWIALGITLHLSVETYLLLGIPLTAAFQWGVRREPLRALWLRDAPPFRLGAAGSGIAGLLAAFPVYRLIMQLRVGPQLVLIGWYLSAIAGAFAAAYALRNFHRATVRPFILCLIIAGGIGIMFMVGGAIAGGLAHRSLARRLSIGLRSLLLYVPVTFFLEEVSFRGAFDSHLHHPGEPREWVTALFDNKNQRSDPCSSTLANVCYNDSAASVRALSSAG